MSSFEQVLAIIGLVVGLVVLLVVIKLLHGTLRPLLAVLADVKSAKTAPMLERGIPGTDQLGTTRRLAESVPPLALAYLQKLGARPAAAAPPTSAPAAPYSPPTPAYSPSPPAYSPSPAPSEAAPAPGGSQQPSELPAWKKYRS